MVIIWTSIDYVANIMWREKCGEVREKFIEQKVLELQGMVLENFVKAARTLGAERTCKLELFVASKIRVVGDIGVTQTRQVA